MTARRLTLFVVLLAAVSLVILYQVRNPEKRDLDASVRQSAAGRFVSLADGVTHYDVAGPENGQRVMLVHGFSVPAYIWDSTSAALSAAGFRVARYDMFGRGFSDRPNVAYSAELFDRQLHQLLDSLQWREPVDLIGLSMGGPVTANFTGQHPERVRSLTLVDPAAGPPATGGLSIESIFRIPLVGPALWQMMAVPGMADGQLSDFVEPARWPDWPERYRVQMQYRGFGRALLSTRQEAAKVSLDSIYTRAGATGIPTLLIWGKEDHTVPIENAERVQRAIPQAQYHPIDHAGHLPHMERGDVVNPLLIQFLHSVSPVSKDSSAKST